MIQSSSLLSPTATAGVGFYRDCVLSDARNT
jgi:hypothetical protein